MGMSNCRITHQTLELTFQKKHHTYNATNTHEVSLQKGNNIWQKFMKSNFKMKMYIQYYKYA